MFPSLHFSVAFLYILRNNKEEKHIF